MDKADVISQVCDALTNDDFGTARRIAQSDYPFTPAVRSVRQYTKLQSLAIFSRDGFIDRYSGSKLIFPGALRLLSIMLPEEFPAHPNWKMTESHLVFWELFPTIDHVIPVGRGGADAEHNWVTTSMLRNSAKSAWTLTELGWTKYPPGDSGAWDGLVNWFVQTTQAHPHLLSDKYVLGWSSAARRFANEKARHQHRSKNP